MKYIKLSKTNCYLLALSEGYLLVDTGYEADKDRFFKLLKSNNIKPQEIRFLFLTHHHDDHSGLLNDLIEQNPEIRIILSKEASNFLTKGVNTLDFGGAWCNKSMKKAAEFYHKINRKWSLSFPPYFVRENDIVLSEDNFSLGQITGRKLIVLKSPGHSTDAISLLDEDMNLFCGDSAANYLRILGTCYAPPFITDFEQFYSSWQKFIDMGVKTLYPSHGKPIDIAKIKKNIYKLKSECSGEFKWD